MSDFGLGSLSLNEPLKITVPVKAKGLIIGKGGETIKSIMAKTRTKIASSRDRSDSTFTITGSSSEAINAAKSEIDVLVASFHKSKKAPPRDANNNYQASCGGKLPKNWVNCPVTGQTLIDDFLLPVKCPLHDNFTAKVKQAGESLWRLEELFQLAHDKFDKKIGLIIDLTDTNRYYNPTEAESKGVEHRKLPLNLHRPDGLPFKQIHAIVAQIETFRENHPNAVVAVHCTHGFNRTGLLIVSYLVRVASSNLIDALKTFEKSRQDIGIYRQPILDALCVEYGASSDQITCPPTPQWAREQ